jgi:lysosomal Pro-X carboxypeptidase
MAGDNPNAVHREYLTYEQAMMDFVRLLGAFQTERQVSVPVIAFGGSYGAMLAFWLRATYPHVIAGAIAASAPLRVFAGWQRPQRDWDSHSYWQVITRGANATGGSAPRCSLNVRRAFDVMMALGESAAGRAQLASIFRTCSRTPLESTADVERLYKLMVFTFDTLSMGNYPYASNYLTGGRAILPPFPLRKACKALAADFGPADDSALLAALSVATQVVTNASQREACIPLPSVEADDGQDCVLCDYFACTNANPLETSFARDGLVEHGGDMFLPHGDPKSTVLGGVNVTMIEERCARLYGTAPRWYRMVDAYGGATRIPAITNVVYSNGFLDQWSSAGVTWVDRVDSTSILIAEAAHHLDLMFSHPDDPPSVTRARETERRFIRRWVDGWPEDAHAGVPHPMHMGQVA